MRTKGVDTSPIHKLLYNFSATLRLVGNFQLIEQLSVHRATFELLCLDSHSYAPATNETIKKCRIYPLLRIYLPNLLVLLLGSTCFCEKVCLRSKRL